MNAEVLMLKGYLADQDEDFQATYKEVRALLDKIVEESGDPAVFALALLLAEIGEDA